MENKLVKLLAQFYALDHRGKFQFCKESEEACSWVNASSTREIDCRICIQEALDKRDDPVSYTHLTLPTICSV